jgi:hypothetical protein
MAAFGGEGEKADVSKVDSVSEVTGGGEAVAARWAARMAVGSMEGYGPARSCRTELVDAAEVFVTREFSCGLGGRGVAGCGGRFAAAE